MEAADNTEAANRVGPSVDTPLETKSDPGERTRIALDPPARRELERELRKLLAEERGSGGTRIFKNKTFGDLVKKLPATKNELQGCWGLKKEEHRLQYGDLILRIISSYLRRHRCRGHYQQIFRPVIAPKPFVSSRPTSRDEFKPASLASGENFDENFFDAAAERARNAEARGDAIRLGTEIARAMRTDRREPPNNISGPAIHRPRNDASHGASAGAVLDPPARARLGRDLRELRARFARAQRCEPFRIFQERSLDEILAKLPTNEARLRGCWGINVVRCRQYGDSILHVINTHLRRCRRRRAEWGQEILPVAGTVLKGQSESAAVQTVDCGSNPSSSDSELENDDVVIETGRTLSMEDIVAQRVREAEARGEVLEILE